MNKPFSAASPCPALLLIGPTGSGKTPLGELIEARGLANRRGLHFDFGSELRRASESDGSDMSEEDRALIRRVLQHGALLEPEHFPVAERLLKVFLARGAAHPSPGQNWSDRVPAVTGLRIQGTCRGDRGPPGDLSPVPTPDRLEPVLILNGLPRHVQQAEALRSFVDVQWVVELRCTPEVVLARLRRNTGGDRAGRIDDDESLVKAKLALYDQRTRPLVAYYRGHGVPVVTAKVTAETSPDALWATIDGFSRLSW